MENLYTLTAHRQFIKLPTSIILNLSFYLSDTSDMIINVSDTKPARLLL